MPLVARLNGLLIAPRGADADDVEGPPEDLTGGAGGAAARDALLRGALAT